MGNVLSMALRVRFRNLKDLCIIQGSVRFMHLVFFCRAIVDVLMELFLREATDRTGIDDRLFKIDALLDWTTFSSILKRSPGRSGLGPCGYEPPVLFKCLLVGQWHGLSDPKPERALKVRLDLMLFCGLDLHGTVPDETTHCLSVS